MKISIVGAGYVGLVSSACFAELGVNVTCIDNNKGKIDALINGVIPIYEPGLDDLVHRNQKAGRLRFSVDLTENLNDVEILFIAVGTPSGEDGSADMRYVLEVAKLLVRDSKNTFLSLQRARYLLGPRTGSEM